jgi:isoleucyl-tRNA synthetase
LLDYYGLLQIKERSKTTEEIMEKTDQNTTNQFSFVETEKNILEYWTRSQIFKKSLEQTKANDPYIFYDGPPFATGLPHHGHLVASTLKDIIPRYFTMKGRYVSRRFGWDCHGLPIEQEIDKKFEMSANDFVAKYGVQKYNQECRSIVDRYVNEWEKTISRLGRWVDFKNDYKTMDVTFMESVWWVFKQVWDKGLIYQGNKIVPYSPKLQTALSNFEASSNYQDVQDPAITVLFKLEDEQTYIAAWTTTPWTLPANLALIVNQEVEYVKLYEKNRDINLIMARERVASYQKQGEFSEIDSFKGKELVGKKYLPLFDYFKNLATEGAFQIVADDYVTTSDGTGIVHAAPAFGEDDNRVLKANKINAIVCPIDAEAHFTGEVTDLKGKYIKDADKDIIKMLKDKGQLFHQSVLVHSYPYCPRTDTPLVYRMMPQWYLNVEQIKDKMIQANQKINWVPDHIQNGRFGKWLEGARDWAISRNRVWGTPLPIWINDESGKSICVGSIAELKQLSGIELGDLHREFVDPIEFKIAGESGTYRRIPEVLDCWFESGSMPYAQLHYPFENKQIFDQGFPAEFIAEGLDQTRGWFYTLTVLSAALFDKPAFKNVIVNGLVLAEDGKKMSKRLKNYTPPDELMESHGADALRLFLINSGLVKAEELRFSDAGVKDMVRRALLPWFNAFKFFQTYAEVDQYKPTQHFKQGTNILDQWLLSRLQSLIANMEKEMEAYRLYNVVPELFIFIEDLTNWYIRLNRRRFWGEGLSEDKKEAYSTLYVTLLELEKLMAPFAPYLSEFIYLELKKLGGIDKESVHLESYPQVNQKLINPVLEDAVNRMQQVILLGRQKRNQKQIKVKTPLSNLTVIHQDQSILNEIKKLESYLKVELNVKKVSYDTSEDKYIKLYAKPNSPILGKKLGKQFASFRSKIEALNTDQLKALEAGEQIQIDGVNFENDDILIFREAKPGSEAISNRSISLELDCNIDEDLMLEGIAREVINRIQKTRKDKNFNVADRIQIEYLADELILNAINKHMDYICKETLCTQLSYQSALSGCEVFEIEGNNFEFNIQVTNR